MIASGRGGEPGLPERIDGLLTGLGFALTRTFSPARVVDALGGDKKRERGVQRWILPMAIGRVEEATDLTDAEVASALDAISA